MTQEVVVAEVAPDSVTSDISLYRDTHPRVVAAFTSIAAEVATSPPSDDFVLGIMEDILSAETFEEIFAAQEKGGMTSGKDFANRPFFLQGSDIQWQKSRHKAVPFYALMKVTDFASGEEIMLNCGGKTFVCVLRGLQMAGYFTEEKGCPPEGRSLYLRATETGEGAYLSLMPHMGAAKAAAATGKKRGA